MLASAGGVEAGNKTKHLAGDVCEFGGRPGMLHPTSAARLGRLLLSLDDLRQVRLELGVSDPHGAPLLLALQVSADERQGPGVGVGD
jgi:hypothetical protein